MATLRGSDLKDTLAGTEDNDQLFGNGGNDTLRGFGGDDLLDGGPGIDTMIGGRGDDTYVVDTIGERVIEAAGEGVDLVQASVRVIRLSANVENLKFTVGGPHTGTGNELDNRMEGNGGRDFLLGKGGNDQLFGLGGADVLSGGTGNDTLDGGGGADVMYGGPGDDTFIVDNARDRVAESRGQGIDTVQTGISYVLPANVENLVLSGTRSTDGTGNSGDNAITGNSGRNTLSGGDGNDTLDGGVGADTLTGGDGADTFLFTAPVVRGNADTITDFEAGVDRIALSSAQFTRLGGEGALGENFFFSEDGATEGTAGTHRLVYDSASGELYYDRDGSGGADGVLIARLGDGDFHPILTAADFLIVA